MTSSP
jgi:hypothetical protein